MLAAIKFFFKPAEVEIMDLSEVPVEILCNILKFVDEDTLLFSCRLVSHQWKSVIDELVWLEKLKPLKKFHGSRLPFWSMYFLCKKKPFGTNILTNTCGEQNLKGWDINHRQMCIVEKKPVGSHPLPSIPEFANKTSCFATSYVLCTKRQVVKLSSIGLSDEVMDMIRPEFIITDWICTRFDCGGIYILETFLLGEDEKLITGCSTRKELMAGSEWVKVQMSLKSFGPGGRYFVFQQRGKDNQYWAGHYGVKIAGSSVIPCISD